LDVILYSAASGSIVFDVVRINPYTGEEAVVVDDYVINFTGYGIYTAKIQMEATRSGFWMYALRTVAINGSPPPYVFLIGLWLGIDEYYDYGVDNV